MINMFLLYVMSHIIFLSFSCFIRLYLFFQRIGVEEQVKEMIDYVEYKMDIYRVEKTCDHWRIS